MFLAVFILSASLSGHFNTTLATAYLLFTLILGGTESKICKGSIACLRLLNNGRAMQ